MYVYPDADMRRWSVDTNCGVVLANSDYYYTKEQTDKLIEDVGGMTPEDVQRQIDNSIRTKADKSEVNELAEQVRANSRAILDRYTKSEVNNLLSAYKTKLEANSDIANYAKVDNLTLSLNDQNVGVN